jgi:hypothetical protein
VRLALALITLLVSSCLSGDYERFDAEMPPKEAAIERLMIGESDLTTCLDELGAPLQVIELGAGAVMAWGARRDVGWNVSANIPLSDSAGGTMRFSREHFGYRGVVLFFDEQLILEQVKRGWLAEIVPEARPRPQFIED